MLFKLQHCPRACAVPAAGAQQTRMQLQHTRTVVGPQLFSRSNVLPARRERANLRVQLQDTRATVGTLRNIMAVLAQAINCFFWLAIYNVRCATPPCPSAPPVT